MRSSKKTIAILLVIIAVVAVGVAAFLQWTAKPLVDVSLSVASVEPLPPAYIGNSSIYLLSANPSYGTYDGSPCFIINVTIRNDYTPQHPVDNLYNDSQGRAWFIMYAKLYDKSGNEIQSHAYIPPNGHPNWNQKSISSNVTETLTIYMVTSSRDIDHYSLAFGWLGTIPAP